MTRPFGSRLRIRPDFVAAAALALAPLVYFQAALRGEIVLCPDDGLIFNVPLRVAAARIVLDGHAPLWNPYIFSGMPLLGSAQGGLLFPPNWFYLALPATTATNLMVVSAYVLAGVGAYLYARRSGASVAGALTTGLVWQWGGFMVAQLSHVNVAQTAAMLPWILWALDGYGASGGRRWGALLSVFVALQAFVGHQQTFAYSLLLAAVYAVMMSRADARTRARYLWSLAFIAAGVLIAAVQILPTFELLRNSLRAAASYDFFTSFSMPRRFVLTLFAPYVMGGGDGRLFRAPYVGPAFYAEFVAYVGVLTIMLALVAVVLKRDARTKFWTVAALVCLTLALGRYAPFGVYKLIYYVPILNLFRVPARHLMEAEFALAVLAGRGLTALAAARGDRKTINRVVMIGAFVLLLTCLAVTWGRPDDFRLAREAPLSLLRAPELFLPVVFAALSACALYVFARGRRGATALLLAVLVLDLAVWGQSSGWRVASPGPDGDYWHVPETVKLLRGLENKDPAPYRILTAPHPFDPAVPPVGPAVSHSTDWVLWTQPDIYMMHGIENAAGYDGFGLARYSRLAGNMAVWGELPDPDFTLRGEGRELDLLNVRYLLSMRQKAGRTASNASLFPPATHEYGGFRFAEDDLGLPNLASGKRLPFSVPPTEADRVALLTNLSWSESVPDGTTVAHMRLHAQDGRVFDFPLRAGKETAEWAYDRADIRARIRHSRPTVATSYAVKDAQSDYDGHTYVASFALPEKVTITGGEIVVEQSARWPDLTLGVFRVSLLDTGEDKVYALRREWVGEGTSAQTSPQGEGEQGARWHLIAQTSDVDIYENARALPRVWLATDARALSEQATRDVIRTGKLPDGSKWEPLRTALVESETSEKFDGGATEGRAEVTRHEPNRVEVKTATVAPSILVLSENHYPGWRAYLDGRGVGVLRVNYNLRGVVVPAGEHKVEFVYRPKSVLIGLVVSLLVLAALVGWTARRLPEATARRVASNFMRRLSEVKR